uniref:Uncharacterized protein n=1 Tax=viral metagenome TaxID=1070528 RepID=A0A6C0C6C5_9ZZZZ
MKNRQTKVKTSKLTYGYVKFGKDEYELVCIELMNQHFDEFKTISAMMNDMEFKYHHGLPVINHLSKSMHYVFNVLNRFLTLGEQLEIESVNDQIMFLRLLCKLAARDSVCEILNESEMTIKTKTWRRLTKEIFDAKNCLDEEIRLNVYKTIRYTDKNRSKNIKYANFYGFPCFKVSDKFNIYVHKKNVPHNYLYRTYRTQHRIYHEEKKIFYRIIVLGDMGILYDPIGFHAKPKLDNSNDLMKDLELPDPTGSQRDEPESIDSNGSFEEIFADGSSNSQRWRDSVTSSDDTLNKRGRLICDVPIKISEKITELQADYINYQKYHNYVIGAIDVHIDGKVISMKMILTTCMKLAELSDVYYFDN